MVDGVKFQQYGMSIHPGEGRKHEERGMGSKSSFIFLLIIVAPLACNNAFVEPHICLVIRTVHRAG